MPSCMNISNSNNNNNNGRSRNIDNVVRERERERKRKRTKTQKKKMEKTRSRIGFVKECYKITTAYISHSTNTPTHKTLANTQRQREREGEE